MNGGYNYSNDGEPELFASVEDAAAAYVDRYNSNGLRKCVVGYGDAIEYVFFPGWGEFPWDEYIIHTPETGEGWTKREVWILAGEDI